eukprot:jgi/Galph1/6078/GphlegSOOS_G4709.1
MGNHIPSGTVPYETPNREGLNRNESHSYYRRPHNSPYTDLTGNFVTYPGVSGYGTRPGRRLPSASSSGVQNEQRDSISRANLILEGTAPSNQQLPSQQQPSIKCGYRQTNVLNLKKHSLKLAQNEFCNLFLEFRYDALVKGTLTIYMFAMDRTNYEKFESIVLDSVKHGSMKRHPFQPGIDQLHKEELVTSSGLDMYSEKELFYQGGNFYPLVIVLQADLRSEEHNLLDDSFGNDEAKHVSDSSDWSAVTSQITYATFTKNNEQEENTYGISVLKQYAQIGHSLYELEDIYGYDASSIDEDVENTNLCIACMLNESDALLLPCRHLCMCAECADRLRFRSNKCPVCRQVVDWILQVQNLDKTPSNA